MLTKVPRLFDATRLPFINGHYAGELTDPLPPCAMVAPGVPSADGGVLSDDDTIGAINAALYAASILALSDDELARKLGDFRDAQRDMVLEMTLPPQD